MKKARLVCIVMLAAILLSVAAAQLTGGATPSEPEELLALLITEGEEIYKRTAVPACASCHGSSGEGGVGPKLVANPRLDNGDAIIRRILRGSGQFMPSYRDKLTDGEIAAVATYIRNSWGNELGLVSEEEVSAMR